MLVDTITPRFCDTDALGHISNTTLPVWFEGARDPIFRWFTPDLDPQKLASDAGQIRDSVPGRAVL